MARDNINHRKRPRSKALKCYMRVAKHLLPKIKASHNPVLWHPDLHRDNIFVDPEEQTKIIGIIDRQAAHIAPMFLQVHRPALLQAKKLQKDQAMYVLCEIEHLKQCRDWLRIERRNTLTSQITGLVGSLFVDGEPAVLGYLMQVVDRWAASSTSPIHFPESSKQKRD